MKKSITMVLAVLLVFALVACGGPASTASATSAAAGGSASTASPAASDAASTGGGELSDKTFAYCAASTNDYWTVLQEGVNQAASDLGIDISVATANEGDVAALVNLVENAISANVDGIITAASDPDGFIEVLNRAVESGIVVVTVDQDSPNSDRQYFVGTSNYDAGVVAGEKMIELTGGEAKIAVFAGTITASNAVERMAGFKDAIANEAGMEIITYEEVKNDVLITMQKTEAVLNGFPEVTAFYGVFAYDPLGAAKAVDEAGRGDEITIVGFDDLEESVELLKEGVINALLVQQPYEIGYTAVEICVDAVMGNGPEPGAIGTPILVVDESNVNELY